MTPVQVIAGDSPVVLGQPHGGTWLPPGLAQRLNPVGQALADTDWHIDRLYDGLLPGASVVRATFHRYVIDANRDPSGVSLYPGQNTTDLCPVTDFDGRALWHAGEAPQADEIEERRRQFHAPYHAALAEVLEHVRARHGFAILWDCHSIRSHIPFLFDGVLPDLNIGTNGGTTCAPALQAVALQGAANSGLTHVLNGRFKGGWTTRHYGRPTDGLHAIQMEVAQSAYLAAESPPWTFDARRAQPLRACLSAILTTLSSWRPQ